MLKRSLLPIIIILAFVSCGEKRYPSELVMADSAYMRGDYKRADSLLDVYIVNSSVNNDEDSYAYSRLLCLCEKFVRSGITGSDLPLADSLSSYFKNRGAIRKYGLSCIFLGNAFQNGEDYPSAMECYLTSRQISMELNDSVMLGWVEKAIGNLYFDQRMLDKCIPYYQHCYEIAHAMKDTLRMAQTSYQMALVSTIKSDADSAIYFYEKTIDLGKNSQLASLILAAAKQQISDIYIQIEEYGNALKYMSRDSINSANWGYFHYGQHHLDSAAFYFKEVYENEKLRGRADMLFMLSAIEEEKGNVVNAIDYLHRYVSTLDSLQAQTRTEETMRVQAQFNYNNIQREALEHEHEANRAHVILIIVVALVVFIAVITALLWSRFKEKKEREMEAFRKEYANAVDTYQHNLESLRIIDDTRKTTIGVMQSKMLTIEHELREENEQLKEKLSKMRELSNIQKSIKRTQDYFNSQIVQHIYALEEKPLVKLNKADKEKLLRTTREYFPSLIKDLNQAEGITQQALYTAILVSLNVHSSGISNLLDISSQQVANLKRVVNTALFNDSSARTLYTNLIQHYEIFVN